MPDTHGGRDDQPWSHLADLARETFERQVKLGREYAELARSSLSGEGDRSEAGRAYLSAVRREGEHYWREMSTIGLSYASEVAVLGARAAGAVARDVRAAMARSGTATGDARGEHHSHNHHEHDHHDHDHHDHRDHGTSSASDAGSPSARPPAGATAAEPSARPRVEVALHAAAGRTATATVTVANQHPRPRRITLQAGPIRDADGTEVDAEIEVSPTRVTVPAGEETTVTLELAMDADIFAADSAYICIIEVSGGEEATVVVHIRLDAPSSSPSSS